MYYINYTQMNASSISATQIHWNNPKWYINPADFIASSELSPEDKEFFTNTIIIIQANYRERYNSDLLILGIEIIMQNPPVINKVFGYSDPTTLSIWNKESMKDENIKFWFNLVSPSGVGIFLHVDKLKHVKNASNRRSSVTLR